MREGQSGRLRGGSVVLDEGLEDGRVFFAAFFEGMAAWGGDDDDHNDDNADPIPR